MLLRQRVVSMAVLCAAQWTIQAQPAAPVYQTLTCVKAKDGKHNEYREFLMGPAAKVAQASIEAGRYTAWTALESVRPAGEEARCDFRISVLSEGTPPEPGGGDALESMLRKAGLKMTAAQYVAQRGSMSRLVGQELWRMRIRVAAPAKGNYLLLNQMRVKKMADYARFENEVWQPLAKEWVRTGEMSSWVFATRVLPSGTDEPFAAYSADIYPDWKSVFAPRTTPATFAKVHSGKDYAKTMGQLDGMRDLAKRELYRILDRRAK